MDPYKGSVELGAHLRHQRKRRGWSQKDAADAHGGVSQSQWSRWEDAKLMPDPIEDFPKLARFLDVDETEVVRLALGINDAGVSRRLDDLERRQNGQEALLRQVAEHLGIEVP